MPRLYKSDRGNLPVIGIDGDYKKGYTVKIPRDVRVIFGPLAPKDYQESAEFALSLLSRIHHDKVHLMWRNEDMTIFTMSEILCEHYKDTPTEEQPILVKTGGAGTFTMTRAGSTEVQCYSRRHSSAETTGVTGFLEALNSLL